MNQERKEELLVKWVDETLSLSDKEELTKLLEAEPELADLKTGHMEVGSQLREAFPSDGDVPYGDFFATRLKRAIEDDAGVSRDEGANAKPSLWSQFLRWGAVPAMAAALVVAFLAGTQVKPPEVGAPEFVVRPDVYTPAGGVSASYASFDTTGTVILLEGLESIPESIDLIAQAAGYGSGGELAVRVPTRSL